MLSFQGWLPPPVYTYENLKARSGNIRLLFDRDVRGIFKLIKKLPVSNSKDLFNDLEQTTRLVTEIVTDLMAIERIYYARWIRGVVRLDRLVDPIYPYVYKGGMLLGAGVTGAGLFMNQLGSQVNPTNSVTTTQSASSPIGWIGYVMMILAFSLSWNKEKATQLQREYKRFQSLYFQNMKIKTEIESFQHVCSLCREVFDRAIINEYDVRGHINASSAQLALKISTYLKENLAEKGFVIPAYLRKVCEPAVINRFTFLLGPTAQALAEASSEVAIVRIHDNSL